MEVMPHAVAPMVHVRGEIDLSNTDAIRAEARRRGAARRRPGSCSTSPRRRTSTAAAFALLFDLAERLQARRQRLVLVVTEEALVRRVLVLTKLDDAVPLHETVR